MNLGFMPHGTISKKKRIHWEGQFLAFVRDFKDGITFFKLRLNLDLYKDSHSPAFQIELTIFNVYNHIWIYQNNPDDEWNDFTE
jgi:hypothetical protein